MTTEVFKRAFPAEKLLGQSPVLAIAILFLFYQERRETRETESAANRETRIIELQKANHKVLEDHPEPSELSEREQRSLDALL